MASDGLVPGHLQLPCWCRPVIAYQEHFSVISRYKSQYGYNQDLIMNELSYLKKKVLIFWNYENSAYAPGALLLTWNNFAHPFLNFSGCTVEV